jgi:hypothetical protein
MVEPPQASGRSFLTLEQRLDNGPLNGSTLRIPQESWGGAILIIDDDEILEGLKPVTISAIKLGWKLAAAASMPS